MTSVKQAKSIEYLNQGIYIAHQYNDDYLHNALFDQPICLLPIHDTLERSCIVYVSPFIIKTLNLNIDPFLHQGFQAFNHNRELIIKMVTWKKDYFGDVSEGTEVPRLEGTAAMIRSDYFQRLLKLYKEEVSFHYIADSN